jgi:protein-arginine kinase activator protein McsA
VQLRAAIAAAVAKEDYEAAASMKKELWALEQGADLAEQDGRCRGDIAEI